VVVKAGYADLPTRPGFGVTLNERIAAQHPYKPVNRQNYVFSDGLLGSSGKSAFRRNGRKFGSHRVHGAAEGLEEHFGSFQDIQASRATQ
jgi:hypothetical protein